MGPYEIDIVYPNGSVKIHTIDENKTPLLVNGHRLRLYRKPLSKEEFVKDLLKEAEVEIYTESGLSTFNHYSLTPLVKRSYICI
jgi:hypothetical protein